jgi:hypothetical protein
VIERTGCFAIRRSARRTSDAVIQRVMRTSLRYHRDTVTDFTEIYPISMEESNLQSVKAV